MPVEIRELVIRAVTTVQPTQDENRPVPDQSQNLDQEAIIQACVKQVLRILKKKEER